MNQTEFEHIAKELRQTALNVASKYINNADSVEDIAQDVMLKLWSVHKDIEQSGIRSLTFSVARNTALDYCRKSRKIVFHDDMNICGTTGESAPDDRYIAEEELQQIIKRMEKLPPSEYQILKLRQIEMKSNSEIASLLGIEKASVATILARARKKIFKDFDKYKAR
ncbi:MAG: RNA polymerase sigma factor [Prevotella sp.]